MTEAVLGIREVGATRIVAKTPDEAIDDMVNKAEMKRTVNNEIKMKAEKAFGISKDDDSSTHVESNMMYTRSGKAYVVLIKTEGEKIDTLY